MFSSQQLPISLFRLARTFSSRLAVSTILLLCATSARAQETVVVDLATDRGPATQRASGFLHSVSATEPATQLLAPVKPRLIRCWSDNCFTFYERLKALGSEIQVIVSDLGPDSPSPVPSQNYTDWENLVRSQVDRAKSLGYTFQWDIWNEPNLSEFWSGTQTQFFEAWRRGVIAARESDPTAVIVGPSITGFDQAYLQSFLLYAKANNVLPNVLSWHEFGGGSSIPSHAQTIRGWMASNGIGIQRISINEMINLGEYTNPGITTRYLAGAERAGVDSAAHACWPDGSDENCWTPSLDGLLTASGTQRRSAWWAYKGYADVTGTIVDLTPSSGVDGVAGRDVDLSKVAVVLGRTGGAGTVNVQFRNVNGAPFLLGSSVRVLAQRIPNSGSSALSAPTTVIDSTVNISNNQINVSLPSFGSGEAFTVTLTSLVDTTPPSVTAVTPQAGAVDIATNTPVIVTFTEAMSLTTISQATLQLVNQTTGTPATVSIGYDSATNLATLTPSAPLDPGTVYTVVVAGGSVDPLVKDLAGNAMTTSFSSSFTTEIPNMVTAPGVVGQTQSAASSSLALANLTLGSVTSQASASTAIGIVMTQSPVAGTSVPEGSSVSVVVSSGVTVPNVVAQTQAAAAGIITDAGLAVGTTTNAFSNAVPAGSVISQSPAGGAQVNGGSAVAMVVSLGPSVTLTRAPGSTVILTGTLSSGAVSALASNDNNYYSVSSTSSGTRTTSWYGSMSGVASDLSNLLVNYRGSNSAQCTQTIFIWRWNDSTWVQLDSRSVSISEVSISNLAPAGAASIYVSSGGEVRVRVLCTRTSGSFTARGETMSIVYDVPDGPPPPDNTAPVLSSGQPTGTLAIGTTQATLSLVTNEAATCRYSPTSGMAYGSMPTTFTTTGGTSHSSTVTGLSSGSQAFYVRCQDPAGNATSSDYAISFTIAADTTPPVLSNGLPTGTLPSTTTQVLLSLATNEAATCRYASTAGVTYGAMTDTFGTTGGSSHSSTVTGLSSGSYAFYVRCQDTKGNATTGDYTISFSIAVPDTAAPVLSNGLPTGTLAAGTTQTTLSLSTNEAASCRYALSPGVAYGSMPATFSATGGTSHSSAMTGLANGGSYNVFVRCQDTAGNPTQNDFTIAFAVAMPPPPAVPGSPAPANSATGVATNVALTWSASGATSYDVSFGTANPPPLLVANLATASTSPGALAQGTTYYWRVVAKSPNGSTTGPIWSFTTAVPAPPSTPSSPSPASGATGVATSATLSWSASGATSYDLSFGTSNPPPVLTTGLTTTAAAPGTLLAGTTYFWRIVARTATASTTGPVWSFTVAPPAGSSSNFGLTTKGSVLDSGDSNALNGSLVTITAGGTATSISVYVGSIDSSSTNRQFQLAIYTNSGGRPGTRVATSTAGTLVANSWNTVSISGALQANTSYWLMFNTNGRTSTVNNMFYNDVTSGQGVYSTSGVTYGTWPTTFPASTLTTARYSIYVTVGP